MSTFTIADVYVLLAVAWASLIALGAVACLVERRRERRMARLAAMRRHPSGRELPQRRGGVA